MNRLSRGAIAALALVILGNAASAQRNASEPASISQTVDGTKISVDYSRPRARGRTGLFGTQVPQTEVWTPGANSSTTLAVSKDVSIDGHPVPQGKYSVWLVMTSAPWEMVLDRDTTLLHTQGPKNRPGQIRFPVPREKRPFMEVLTWWFPEVGSTSATLAMQWDTVFVALHLKVTPSFSTAVVPDEGRRIEGRYGVRFQPMPGEAPAPKDTAQKSESAAPDKVTFTLRYDGGEVRGVMNPPMFSTEPGYTDWMLIPGKGKLYYLGRMQDGEVVEWSDMFALQFTPANGKATGFEMRAKNDALIATGKRLP